METLISLASQIIEKSNKGSLISGAHTTLTVAELAFHSQAYEFATEKLSEYRRISEEYESNFEGEELPKEFQLRYKLTKEGIDFSSNF